MPPAVKIDKETILNASIELLNEHGINSINSRSIAERIGCSTQPVFSTYGTMTNLLDDTIAYIENFFFEYLKQVKLDEYFFLNIGKSYINFSKEYKNFFAALFLLNNFKSMTFEEYVNSDKLAFIRDGIKQFFNVNEERATNLFLDMWIYSHGIACMISTNNIEVDDNNIEAMLTNVFFSLKKFDISVEETNEKR